MKEVEQSQDWAWCKFHLHLMTLIEMKNFICASTNMAIYAIEMTKLDFNGNLVTLQPGSSPNFSENDLFNTYVVHQISTLPHFIVYHCYFDGDVDMANYTTTKASFNA